MATYIDFLGTNGEVAGIPEGSSVKCHDCGSKLAENVVAGDKITILGRSFEVAEVGSTPISDAGVASARTVLSGGE